MNGGQQPGTPKSTAAPEHAAPKKSRKGKGKGKHKAHSANDAPRSPTNLQTATLTCNAEEAPKGPSCDVRTLTVSFNEIESGSQKAYGFDTAVAAGDAPSLRPRDTGIDKEPPERIRKALAAYDLVLEVLAPEPGRAYDKHEIVRMDSRSAKKNLDHLPGLDPKANAIVRAKAAWKVQCPDPDHATITLSWAEEPFMPLAKRSPIKAATHAEALYCLPVMTSRTDIAGFVKSVLNPQRMGRHYALVAMSCGKPSDGAPTRFLNTLVIAYPTGTTGIELEFGPFGWDIGWKLHEAGEKREEAKKDYSERKEAAEKVLANGIVSSPRKISRKKKGKKGTDQQRKYDEQAAAAKKSRKENAAARAELDSLRPPPKNLLSSEYWSEEDKERKWYDPEITVIVADRVFSAEEIEQQYASALDAARTIGTIMDLAASFKDRLMMAFEFIRNYSPSLVRPTASLSLEALGAEVFVGHKLTSTDELRGTRWRGLEPFWDVELDVDLLHVNGSLGITVGRMIIGTGAQIELLVSLDGVAQVAYEAKGLATTFPPHGFDQEAKGIGALTLNCSLLGQASILYYELAAAGGEVAAGCRVLASVDPAEFFVAEKWDVRFLGDPIVATVFARSVLTKSKEYKWVLWGGTEGEPEQKKVAKQNDKGS